MTTDAPTQPTKKAEQKRGYQEASRQIELLKATWPKAFPAKAHEIRPLTSDAKRALMDTFGWSPAYARAVLMVWKIQPAYCQATLCYSKRINLDGSVSDQEVDDKARASAKATLDERAARRAMKRTKAEQERLRAAAEASAEPEAPAAEPAPTAIAETKPAAPPEPPPAPPKPGKLLVAGSAAMQEALKRRLASGSMTTEVLKTVPAAAPGGRREQRAR